MKSLISFTLLSALALSPVAGRAADSIWKFDFGWKELDPPKGFVKVTKQDAYAKETGWGFATNCNWGGSYSGRFPHTPSAAHKHLDEIARDGVWLSGTFTVDVPNGDYLVWYLEGDLGTYALGPIWDHLSYSLTIAGKELHKPIPWDKEVFRKEFYRGIHDDYRRGEDVYERFVAPLMDDKTVEVTVTNNQLSVVGGGVNLCGMMICPASQKTEFDNEVARLRKHRRDHFYSVVKVQEPKFEGTAAPINEQDQKRGYQIWPCHKMREVGPNTRPEADEIGDALKAYVAQDQNETITFAIRPLADLKSVRVSVSDLVSPDGSKIAREGIRIRTLFCRVQYDGAVIRSHLPAFTTADLPREITRQFWLTFNVPAGARPGIYAGKVSFSSDGHPPTDLAVKVKVLGFALRKNYQDASFVLQDTGPALYAVQMADRFPGEYMAGMKQAYQLLKGLGLLPQLADMAARTVDPATPTQRVVFAEAVLKSFSEEVETYQAAFPGTPLVVALHRTFSGYWTPMNRGPNGWPLSNQPDSHWAALKEYLEGYVKLHNQHPDWPEFYYVIGAEMSNGGEDHVLFGKKCVEIGRSIPGLKIITCPNGLFEARTYAPLVDVIAPNFAVPMTDPAFKGIPNEKTRLWIYQAFNRFSYGFYAAKVKATGSFKEYYTSVIQRPYNEFDGADLLGGVALSSPDGPVATPLLEEFGWGVTDLRYIKTLEEFIAKARSSGKPKAVEAANDAEKMLANLLDGINPDLDYYMNQAGWWDYSVYDTYRWQVAEKILKIQASL